MSLYIINILLETRIWYSVLIIAYQTRILAQIAVYDSNHSHSFTSVYLWLYFETKLYMHIYSY